MRRVRSGASERSEFPEPKLGQKVSILFRIDGDPQHPFSEVVGIVQRISEENRVYHVVKRDGTLVEVPAADVVKLKIVPTGRGPLRVPKSWSGRA